MSDIRVISGIETVNRISADGSFIAVRGSRDGAPIAMDWKLAMAMEGRVFHAGAGIDLTPITAIAFDQNRPNFWLSIPAGTTILPLRVEVAVLSAEEGTDGAMYIARTTAAPSVSAGAAAGEAVSCTRTDLPRTSNVTARQLADADITITGYSGVSVTARPTASLAPFNLLYEPKTPEVLVGPAGLYVNTAATSTAMLIRIMVEWAEFPSNQVA